MSTTGYLLLFTLDNGRDLCLSVILPGCNETLVDNCDFCNNIFFYFFCISYIMSNFLSNSYNQGSFSLSMRGICSEDPEIHKLLDIEVVSQGWL